MRVRPATPGDAAAITAHSMALAAESEDRVLDGSTVRAAVEAALADSAKARYVVAEDDGLAGSLFVTREWSDWTGGWYWWIQGVYVEPDHRGSGVYRAMVDTVRALAREAGDVRALRMYAHKGNTAGLAAHRGVGFREAPYVILEDDV